MKTIKPQKLSVLHKVFEDKRTLRLCVSMYVFFPFDRPQRLLPEVSMWKFLPAELGENVILDECMPKPRPEVLVDGYAYPPGPGEQSVCRVRLQLGSIDKQLYVVGDRHWEGGNPSEPRPFSEMRVDWAHAFGGEGFEKNPLGKGAVVIEDEESGNKLQPLPNIENPKQVVSSPRDKPEPAGFGYIDLTWPQRFRHAGTYNRDWYNNLFPGFAADFDWHFFNVAPEDQRLDTLEGVSRSSSRTCTPTRARSRAHFPKSPRAAL